MVLHFSTQSQTGSSLIEHTLSMLLFCLICLGMIESAHWLVIRQALNTALLDTARIAVTQQAHPEVIKTAFKEQLQRLAAFNLKADQHYWSIQHHTLAPATGSVQHSYQALQFLEGNSTVFDQNTLALRLTYGHQPLTPLVRTVVQHSHYWLKPAHAQLAQQGLIPIVTEIHLSMQSDQNQPTTGLIEPLALESALASTKPPSFSSLLWSTASPASLQPWQPTPEGTLSTNPSCTEDYCCGPLF